MLDPQRYVITYRKTKLAVIESTVLFYALLVAKLINVRYAYQISKNVLLS